MLNQKQKKKHWKSPPSTSESPSSISLDENLLCLIENYINQNRLAQEKIALACSGGIDSLVLLKALSQVLNKDLLLCLHLNHGWLEEADAAQKLLENFCQENSIKLILETYPKNKLRQDENSGREARYKFFLEACKQENCKHLFLAHNLNDQAETILFRLFRGTNSNGLTGIPQSRIHPQKPEEFSFTIHRPLLKTNREEIEAYAELNLESYYQDPSNDDDKYHRNLIRNKILSEAKKINAHAEENIVKLGELIKEEQNYFTTIVENHLVELGDLPWSLELFRLIPRTLQRKILEIRFTPSIRFTDEFINALELGGFHRINFEKNKYFTIKQRFIHLELSEKV